jgi:hypothetical protein
LAGLDCFGIMQKRTFEKSRHSRGPLDPLIWRQLDDIQALFNYSKSFRHSSNSFIQWHNRNVSDLRMAYLYFLSHDFPQQEFLIAKASRKSSQKSWF